MTQYWDERGSTGIYLAEVDLGGLGYSGFVYDVFYVFGPGAAWGEEPGPVIGSGAPVLSGGDQLLAALRAQLH